MAKETAADKRARAAEIEDRLLSRYGEGTCSLDYRDPFTLTCAVMLSAQCTDAAVNKVTPILFERFGTPEALAGADPDDIERTIHPLGFFHAKTRNLIAMAQTVLCEFGGKIPEDIDALQTLPGVGRKTANVISCEAFDNPQGIAVDTHVFRIAHRLKLAGPSADTPDKTEKALCRIYPRSKWSCINRRWVHFGRDVCRARHPLCDACPINDLCPSFAPVHRKGKRV